MSTRTPIIRAYCVQLGEVLSIAEARRAFFSLPLPRSRFDFLCSNESCRDLATKPKITAVNYDKQPNDTYRGAHFRENNSYKHSPNCEWMIDEDAEEVDGKLPGESEKDAFLRRARRKLHDYIDVFEPNAGQPAESGSTSGTPDGDKVTGGNRSEGVGRSEKESRNHRTSSLERLVECYRQARQELSEEEFKAMRLRVVGESEMPLSWFFRSISYAKLGTSNRVLHGGATLVGRYGAGFKLKFYDRLDGKLVFLYVSKEQMGEYRFQRYLDELLQQEEADYFRVFALGQLALSPTGKSINLQVDDLKQLVVIPGQKKVSESAHEASPTGAG
ncbi:ATPase [Pseudomonas citronellolis]|uniref:ATPase n=1 Tax=Pseudomonas citronellolis TaxID=53408 RepID=UPI0023E3F8E9|nr:ATPase [Pseudomonas citronellolis]MDF3935813.1 ATPase [Pseudomonas citronellolis]